MISGDTDHIDLFIFICVQSIGCHWNSIFRNEGSMNRDLMRGNVVIDHSEINRQRIEDDCHRRLLINALKSETVAIGTFIHCEDRGLGPW